MGMLGSTAFAADIGDANYLSEGGQPYTNGSPNEGGYPYEGNSYTNIVDGNGIGSHSAARVGSSLQ